jgi:hypothetical protein
MSEQHPTPREVFLEIGPGLTPAAITGSRTFEDGRMYVGIDSSEGDYMATAEGGYGRQVQNQLAVLATKMAVERPDEQIVFMEGNGKHLPLADHSVKEVYMANVLTAPQRPSYRRRLLSEASRVLQDDGSIVVKVSWDAWMWPKDEVTGWMNSVGLKVASVAAAGTEEYAALEQTYGISQHQSSQSYYIVGGKSALAKEK